MTEPGTNLTTMYYKIVETILPGTLSCYFSRVSFQRCLNSEQPWMIQCIQRGRLLTAYHKGFGFVTLRFLFSVQSTAAPLALPCVKRGSGNQHKRRMIHWLLLPGISGPRVSCHLPASMKLWQANLLACK